ncbi:MAG: Fur family peroxide stress response transcriptional regulator [Oceanicoccus sp.]|jgi:Fur family peroxide stress response transcriptional regulator
MDKHIIQSRINYFRETCRREGQRLTSQKQEIFRVLASTVSHPTAQEIFEEVQKAFPKISFATVYDNLRKFKELELINEMNCGEGCSRFDANMGQHHHAIDRKTGKVTDVILSANHSIPIPKELEGEKIRDIKITYFV